MRNKRLLSRYSRFQILDDFKVIINLHSLRLSISPGLVLAGDQTDADKMAVKTIRAVPLVIGYQHPEAARRDRAYKQDTYPVSTASI